MVDGVEGKTEQHHYNYMLVCEGGCTSWCEKEGVPASVRRVYQLVLGGCTSWCEKEGVPAGVRRRVYQLV